MPTPETLRPPYPGLRPFEADEADLFFGREQHVDALLERLSGSRFVAVVGESGAGKSSLVRAGLLPALEAGFVVEAGSDWRVALMRPGGAPLHALADALLTPGVLYPDDAGSHREFALAELRRGPFGLARVVRDAHLGHHCNTLIVVDQFEELFRYCREPAQKDQASIFVELLLQASHQRQVPVFVVLTMRSDFLGDCARFRGLPEALNDNQYLTPRLTRDQLAAAVTGPARVCGGTVETALVDELCNAVGDDQDQLPLLQHLLMRLWDCAGEQARPPRVTAALSHEVGGLRLALSHHAEQIYGALSADRQTIARAMFKSLTEPRSQRRDLRRDALVSEVAAIAAVSVEEAIAVADEFRGPGRHMLMPPPSVPLSAGSRLDVSHESLFRQWSALAEWAREECANAREFDRLCEEARREGEQQGELLSGRDLARALDWKKQANPTAAWAERYAPAGELGTTLDFITRSSDEAARRKDEERRAVMRDAAARRARVYSFFSGGAVVLASVVAIVIFSLWRQAGRDRDEAIQQRAEAVRQTAEADRHRRVADDQRAEATKSAAEARDSELRAQQATLEIERQKGLVEKQNAALARERSEAHISRLTANARLELARDAPLAVLLAREAVLEGASDPLAMRTLREALAAHVSSVEARLLVAKAKNYIPGSNKTAWLDFSLGAGSVSSVGDLVIVPSGNDAVIWSAETGQRVQMLKGHTGIVGAAAFSPNGKLAATASGDHTVKLWAVGSGRALDSVSHKAMVNNAVFNRDATLLVTLGDDDLAQLWTVGDRLGLRCELSHKGNFIAASFSQDERLMATVIHNNGDWSAQVWNLAEEKCPRVSVPQIDKRSDLKWASFSDRGGWLGAVAVDGETILLTVPDWKLQRTHRPQVRYASRTERASAESAPPPLAWSHDDAFVATAGGDNTVSIVPLDPKATPIELRGHTGRVTSIAFSPADDKLVTTSADSTARIWTLDTNKRLLEHLVLSGHRDTVGSGVFSFKGNHVITVSDDGTARAWKPRYALRDLTLPLRPTADPPARVSDLSLGGGLIDGVPVTRVTATLLAERHKELKSMSESFDFQAPRIVEKTAAGLVVHEPGLSTSNGPLAETAGQTVRIIGASPGGRLLLAAVGNTRDALVMKAWDVAEPGVSRNLTAPKSTTGKACSLKAVSDDQRVAWYCADEDVVLVGRLGQTAPVVKIKIADQSRVQLIRFSTGSHLLAMALEDYSVRVFNSSTGADGPVFKGHDGRITGVDFSQDDRFLVSTGEDATARVWDIGCSAQVGKATNVDDLTGATFSRDGRSLLLLSPDRLRVWRCYACGDRDGLLSEVGRRNITRALSADEEARYGLKSSELNAGEHQRHAHTSHGARR